MVLSPDWRARQTRWCRCLLGYRELSAAWSCKWNPDRLDSSRPGLPAVSADPRLETSAGLPVFFNHGLHRAQIIVANSNGTSNRLSELYGRYADLVIRPRVAANFHPPQPETIVAAREHYGIDFPYFLSVATLEPRKNLVALIEAYLELRVAGKLPETGLVLVGQQGWKHRRLIHALTRAKSLGARIVLTGYVPDQWLPALYAGSAAVVTPSLYEGFGMPVLEAQCCGARVVASDVPEIREAGGPGPIYIEPSAEGIKQGLLKAERFSATDTAEVNLNFDRGISWEEEGIKLMNAIRSLV